MGDSFLWEIKCAQGDFHGAGPQQNCFRKVFWVPGRRLRRLLRRDLWYLKILLPPSEMDIMPARREAAEDAGYKLDARRDFAIVKMEMVLKTI